MGRKVSGCAALLLLLAACSESHSHPVPGDTVTEVIGAEGGSVRLPTGARVAIPSGALAEPTSITITVLDTEDVQAIAGGLEAAGATYAFTPHGTTFAHPVTIELPFSGSDTGLRAQRLDDEQDTTWEAMLGGTTRGGVLLVQSRTFSVVVPTRPRTWSGIDGGVMDATLDTGIEPPVTWTATKTTLDVWWSPTQVVFDPGRDTLDLYTLTRTTGACEDESSETVVKVCGIRLPTYTSDVYCDAFQLTIPDSAWDSPSMPSFTETTNTANDNDAGSIAERVATVLLGMSPEDDGLLPVPATADFPDHDGDGLPGITATVRSDSVEYVGPYEDGRCTNGIPYRFRGLPTDVELSAGGGPGRFTRGLELQLGLRTKVAANTCTHAGGTDAADRLETTAAGCSVDPLTLNAYSIFGPDPRLASMDYRCTEDEARFVIPIECATSEESRSEEVHDRTEKSYDGDANRSAQSHNLQTIIEEPSHGCHQPTRGKWTRQLAGDARLALGDQIERHVERDQSDRDSA